MSSRIAGPDFICIGMIKAGTGWLFEQLKHHPDFWMPPVKEIRYLGGQAPEMPIVRKRLERYGDSAVDGKKSGRDERDRLFLQEAEALRGRPDDFHGYVSLFRHKGALLSGDISPIYSRLDEEKIGQIAENLPHAKLVLLVRDPVERAWSGISMLYRHGRFDASLVDDVDRFRAWYRTANKSDRRSFPSRIVQRWRRHAPGMEFRHFFFDDIAGEPEKVRRDILLYVGGDPGKQSGGLAPGHNRKANAQKLVLTEPIRAVLVEHFAEELRACASVLGGPARSWLARYGLPEQAAR